MNLDPAAVSLMLRGKRKMSASEAGEIAKLLGVAVDEVLMRAGSTPTVPKALPEIRTGREWQPMKAAPVRDVEVTASEIELPVPMADGSTARLVLPRAMTKQDAERIAAVVSALALP